MRWRFAVAVLVAVAGEIAAVALTGFATWLICRAAGGADLGVLAIAIVSVRALATGRGVLKYAERLAGHDAVLRLLARLRGRLFAVLVPLAPYRLAVFRRGDLLARLVSDVDAVQDVAIRAALPAVTGLVTGAVTVAWTASVLPGAAVLLGIGVTAAGVVLPLAALAALGPVARRHAAARAELTARTTDLLAGADDLVAAGALARAEAEQRAAARAIAAAETRRAWIRGAAAAVRAALQFGTAAGVAVLAARTLGGGAMTAVLPLVALAAMEVAGGAGTAAEAYAPARPALRRVREVLGTAPAPAPAGEDRPGEQGLRLRAVTFSYPGAPGPAVRGLDLDVPPGRTVALVGPSGSGKSTILGLVLGFLAPDGGTVRLGGRVVTAVPDAELRPALVSGLTQDAYVFRGSIRGNLTLARPDAADEEVWAALDEAGAAAWVRGLPSDVDTVLGPDGATVSGGERQRLALATVLLARPGLLVLDEPMESLDRELADRVLDRLLGSGRTVLLTSHRLAGLEGADEIVVLGDGGVRDRGTHTELLARPGYYRDRYEAERRALDLAAALR